MKLGGDDIFGVSYPWLEDMQLLDDGSLLIMVTQERDDGSANELMFFCCLHFQTYGTCGGIWGICILHLKDIMNVYGKKISEFMKELANVKR